jgi:hypothetical protein
VPLHRALFAHLACPKCNGPLTERPTAFVCDACRLVFVVRAGLPNFLLSDAEPLDEHDRATRESHERR